MWVGSGHGRDRRSERRRPGDRGADAGAVRLPVCIPLAEQRQQQLEGPDLTDRDYQAVTRLGAPFKVYDGDVSPFRVEVAKRIAALNAAAGLPGGLAGAGGGPGPDPHRGGARVLPRRARPGRRWMPGSWPARSRNTRGRGPQTVAGYDLTFSPVKSVSTLWAVADPAVAARDRTGPSGRRRRTRWRSSSSTPCSPGPGAQRDPAGQRPRPGRGRVHPPRQPRRRPGSAHPCRGGEQGADPRRTLAVASTAGCCSRPTSPRRRPTTPPWSSTSATRSGVRFAERPGTDPAQAAGPGDRRRRPRD